MDKKTFFNEVRQMRSLQREYFKTRDKKILEESKKKERLIDEEIVRVSTIFGDNELNEPKPMQKAIMDNILEAICDYPSHKISESVEALCGAFGTTLSLISVASGSKKHPIEQVRDVLIQMVEQTEEMIKENNHGKEN